MVLKSKSFDWLGLEKSCDIILEFCETYGRFTGYTKEKYGTLRFYVQWSDLSPLALLTSGRYPKNCPRWLYAIDDFITKILNALLGGVYFKYQTMIYNLAYQKAIKKYPHLKTAILICSDYPELITGAIEVIKRSTKVIELNPKNNQEES